MGTIRKRVNKDGSVSYQVQIRREGYKHRTQTFKREDEAKRWDREQETLLDKGHDIDSSLLRRDTVLELFERFEREVVPHRKGKRWESVRIQFYKKQDWILRRLNQDVAGALRAWVKQRLGEASNETVRRDLALISSVFTHAIKDWGVPLHVNPVSLVRRPPPAKTGPGRVWPQEALEQLEAKARELGCDGSLFANSVNAEGRVPMVRDYVIPALKLSIETSMRLGELCSFTKENVHLAEKRIWLETSKNGEGRNVLLSSRAVAIVQSLMTWVKTGPVIPVNPDSLGVEFRELRRKAGLTGIRFHDGRHTATTNAAKRFDNAMDLSRFTGHKDLRILDRRYYHPNPTELADKLG